MIENTAVTTATAAATRRRRERPYPCSGRAKLLLRIGRAPPPEPLAPRLSAPGCPDMVGTSIATATGSRVSEEGPSRALARAPLIRHRTRPLARRLQSLTQILGSRAAARMWSRAKSKLAPQPVIHPLALAFVSAFAAYRGGMNGRSQGTL